MHIPDYSKARVLVVGDVMLDRYWTGNTQRISPEAPVPVVRVTHSEDRLGGAGNVAANIRSLGAGTCLVSIIGEDEAGKTLQSLAQAKDIEHHLLAVAGRPTVTKLRVISQHQQLLRMDFEQALALDDHQPILSLAEQKLEQSSALVLSDYAKGTLANCTRLIRRARELGIAVIVDPKGTDWERYRGATLVTPNLTEFQLVAGPCANDEELVSRAKALRSELDFGALLITLSERGMLLVPAQGEVLFIPTRAREVFDVTGAGDTVIGVLAASLGCGAEMAEATRLANAAAGLVVAKLGAATVSAEELSRALHEAGSGAARGVLDEPSLLQQVLAARQRGEKVVMTNGCFDLLHPGHIAYLQEAANLGDRLIVAVNSDASVGRLKGPQRPVTPLADRMTMLAALGCVDWVVPFEEDTPERLISSILPDLLVKGGDYKPQDIAGYQAVTAAGGEVRVLPFQKGYSTTALVNRLKG